MENDDEICELIKKKVKLQKDARRAVEFADVSSRLGYLYFQKGYYEKALEEYNEALKKYKTDAVNLDCANIHRFIGETLCRLGTDLKQAKKEYDIYHAITVKLNDLVEIQRSHITLGNYYMNFTDGVSKHERIEHLNKAYTHYLKAYDLMDEIEEKNLVDKREFALMKTRICLNCAFVLDEKSDEKMSNEYLKTATHLAESNNFYEDLIRCYYIKCDRSKKTNRLGDCIKMADQIVEVTLKTKDFLQQSNDLLYVSEIYISLGAFDKAKDLLKKAYKLRKKCLISSIIRKKLKNIIKIQKIKPLVSKLEANYDENLIKLSQLYEQLADSHCALDNFKNGVDCYKKQLHYAKLSNATNKELSLIYSSIAQTYQDLEDYNNALEFHKLELAALDDESINYESLCKSLINIAIIKEKLKCEFTELKCVYERAFEKARLANSPKLQVKVLRLLKEVEDLYHVKYTDTVEKLNEVKKSLLNKDEEYVESETEDSSNRTESSISLSSESEDEETNLQSKINQRQGSKLLKRNVRGETQLHVACIKGNYSLVKKLVEDGHPVHVRDNFRWTPLHEASNYGHLDIVKILLKNGARYNDQEGPITPLHDAAQNGHFMVVEALLDAGATAYMFTDDGYTPLDFLHKYKIDNEKELSGEDLVLYQKLYSRMYKQITDKNRSYVVKSIINTNNDALQMDEDTDENSNPERTAATIKHKPSTTLTTLKDKSNAVCAYKSAISSIGSKTTGESTQKRGVKNNTSRGDSTNTKTATITEDEYKVTDDWLIDDYKTARSKNKRKFKHDVIEYHSGDSDEDLVTTTDTSDKTDEEKRKTTTTSPISKKRLISYESQNSKSNDTIPSVMQDVMMTNSDSNDSTASLVLPANKTKMNSLELIDRFLKKSNLNPLKAGATSGESSDDFDICDIFTSVAPAAETTEMHFDDSPIVIHATTAATTKPAASSVRSTTSGGSSKSKKQVKINKMDNFNLIKGAKSSKQRPEGIDVNKLDDISEEINERLSERSSSVMSFKTINEQASINTSWKIKANIENRNILIPISNLNATIDDLSKQIIARYKSLFSNEVGFREPLKALLKNDEGFILFDRDLIKDILNDGCQVQLVVETWKDAPKVHELYEKNCLKEKLLNISIQRELKLCETNGGHLCLSNYLVNNVHMGLIVQAIQPNNDYLKLIKSIDFSSNLLDDEFSPGFFNIIEKFPNLKSLNLSNNQFTLKSLIYLSAVIKKLNDSHKSLPIEELNMSSNDFHTECMNTSALGILTEILGSLKLKSIDISDCNFDFNNENSNTASALSSFINMLKSCTQLTHLSLAQNRMSVTFIANVFDALSMNKIISINLENCVRTTTRSIFDSLLKFINTNQNSLESLNLAYFNLDRDHLRQLVNYLCNCKYLKSLNLSHNCITSEDLVLLIENCTQLEKLSVITTATNGAIKYNESTIECLQQKVQITNYPLKYFAFNFETNQEFHAIRELFAQKWSPNSLHIKFRKANIVEFFV